MGFRTNAAKYLSRAAIAAAQVASGDTTETENVDLNTALAVLGLFATL